MAKEKQNVDQEFVSDEDLKNAEDGIFLGWKVPEFQKHERGTKWWVVMTIIGLALVIQALLTANFVFAIILIMGGILIFMTSQRDPQMIMFILTVEGIVIGDRLYPYTDFTEFAILYEPPHVKRLYLTRKKGVRSRFSIPLEDADPNQVREVLGLFLKENLEDIEEPLSETFMRIAKL